MDGYDGLGLLLRYRWKVAAAIALLLLVVLIAYIAAPLADGVMLGIVLAYVGRPLKRWFLRRPLVGRFSSLMTTVCVILPMVVILTLGFIEIVGWVRILVEHHQEVGAYISQALLELQLPQWAYVELLRWSQSLIATPLGSVVSLLRSIPITDYAWKVGLLVLNMLISVFVCYFLLADGERLVSSLMRIVPKEHAEVLERYVARLDSILRGIFMGTIYTAIIVTLISVVVFAYFRIPSTLAFSSLVFIAALIPIFSGAMILGPLAIYRYIEFGLPDAVLFLIVSVLCIYAPAELVIRPYIVSSETRIHPLLLLIAFIGGGLAGGIAGFFLAPILLGALVAAYELYSEDIGKLDGEA